MQKVKISFFDRLRAFLGNRDSVFFINHAQEIVDLRVDRVSWRDIAKSTRSTLQKSRETFYKAIGLSYDLQRTYTINNHQYLEDMPASVRNRLVTVGLYSYTDIYRFVRDRDIPLDSDYAKRLTYIDGIGTQYAETILNWMFNGMTFEINKDGEGRFVDIADISIDPNIDPNIEPDINSDINPDSQKKECSDVDSGVKIETTTA